jgi:hypothetical protein
MKKIYKKYLILSMTIISLVFLGFYFSRNILNKSWQEFSLNREFVCPENQTEEQANAYRSKYSDFYLDNYPNLTFTDFLNKRIELLSSHNCVTTLQNLADSVGVELSDKDLVEKIKENLYGVENPTLKELSK